MPGEWPAVIMATGFIRLSFVDGLQLAGTRELRLSCKYSHSHVLERTLLCAPIDCRGGGRN